MTAHSLFRSHSSAVSQSSSVGDYGENTQYNTLLSI